MPMVQIDGCPIHYDLCGSGEPILFLHGLGSSGLDWERQIGAFASRFRVLTIDLRGHGRSGKPPGPYTMRGFAHDVARVLEALAIGPVHVVGISMGGMVAFQLALDAPQHVRSLIVVNSAPEVIPRSWREKLAIESRRWIVRLLGMRALAKKVARINFPDPTQAALRRALEERLSSNDVAAYRSAMNAIVGWSVLDRIGAIRCPTLVVTGDQDYTPVSLKQAYAAKIPNARLAVIRRSRHVTPVDQPDDFNRVLLDFLAEVPAATAV